MTIEARKSNLEAIMSDIVGVEVELTVRGDRKFTFSTWDVMPTLGEKVAGYFGKLAKVTVEHDEECGSFAYVEVA